MDKKIIEHCKPIILKDVEYMLECNDSIDKYTQICVWVFKNLTRKTWSHHAKMGWSASYGLKHRCEDDLGFYVANNWIKLAMIENGLDVCDANCVDYETGKLSTKRKPTSEDVLNNSINFIYRKI